MNTEQKSSTTDLAESQSLKKKIVEAASKLFEKQGLYETSVAEIADAAGISAPVTYHYVQRKSDIMLLIMEDFTDHFNEMIIRDINELDDPGQKLRRAMEIFFNLVDEKKSKVILLYRESRTLDPEGRRRVMAAEATHVEIFDQILREGIARGVFRPLDTNLAAYDILMSGHTWALKHWHFKNRFNLEAYLKEQTEFFLKAIRLEHRDL